MQIDTTATILTERKGTHGDYRDHARVTQAIMDTVMTGPNWLRLNACQRESLHMFAHKMGRVVCGDPNHTDHWDDIAGYARLVADQLRAPVQKAASVSGQTTGDAGQNGGALWTGDVQDVTNIRPLWPHVIRNFIKGMGAVTYYIPDRSQIDPEVIEEQLCRIAGKLPRMDFENLHMAYRSLYTKQSDGDEYVLRPEFAGWAS